MMADKYNIALETPEYGYTLQSADIAMTTAAGNTQVFRLDNMRGVIHAIYLVVNDPDAAIRLLVDGVEISVSSASLNQLIAGGLDLPHPVYPGALGPDLWVWCPVSGHRLSRFLQSIIVEVGPGATVTGRAIWSKAEM
ncbi:hypothetical protein FTO68_06280 [Methanocalculus taiwanensis]|uniref:Uncharacterized protein n=1 Tax=Methanocalculus taiwanensis TaxID=106207 RepID=A0ABD4TJY8_9EURY|nr:hypothetical protein [Methanocalculus taiwanensis]MCQ1538592.1 hypothetical protein [Methanocalculus taiwanensis]